MAGALKSLAMTVDWSRHRLFVVSNGISIESRVELDYWKQVIPFTFIDNVANIGTARAINKAWQERQPGEHCLKIDSDVLIHDLGWLDKLAACADRDPKLGQVGLKRPDLMENPWAPAGDWSHSDLHMLPHEPGQSWLVVERVRHVMGTCVLHSSNLLDRVGHLYQMGAVYGLDDSNMSVRSEIAGFYNCFLCNTHIDHPDDGRSPFQKWKEQVAGRMMPRYFGTVEAYKQGLKSIFHGPSDD